MILIKQKKKSKLMRINIIEALINVISILFSQFYSLFNTWCHRIGSEAFHITITIHT